MKSKIYLTLAILFSLSILLIAHGGRTDSRGGHNDRKNGGYHYHNGGGSTKTKVVKKKKTKGFYDDSSFTIESSKSSSKTANPYSTTPGVFRVQRVVDGDTIKVRFIAGVVKTVRLIGIDTPETVDPRKQVQYFGKEASAYTKKMLAGKDITLKYDKTKRGKYGRLLAYVYLSDGTLFNEKIIADGYAYAYTKYPFKKEFMTKFKLAEKQARKNKKGLWADSKTKENINKKVKEKASSTGYWLNTKSYTRHNSKCRYYKNTSKGKMCKSNQGVACKICGG